MSDPRSPYDTVIRTLFGECRGEPVEGQRGVAWVIKNRALWRPVAWWGGTPDTVCLHPWQFSCWNKGNPEAAAMAAFSPQDPLYAALLRVAVDVFQGLEPDPTGGATCYQRVGTGASWSRGRIISKIIGAHEFYVIPPQG